MTLTSRQLAGRYELFEILGQGGMAVVHRAHDDLLGRDVAVKLLRPGYAADPDFVARFRAEARHAAGLHHPNIVTVHDTGIDPASATDFIVMQLVDGPDLERIIEQRGSLPVGFAVRVGIETARALAYAHDHGIIHRDIKPGNILIDRDGDVRVADFGIARAVADIGGTTSGMVLGSAQYASPEQVMGEPLGPSSDQYSLGIVLFEALTGVRPFDGPSPAAVALERVRVTPRPITAIDPTLPATLERIVARTLARDPANRYPSAAELAGELERFRGRELGGVRRPGSRPRLAGAAARTAAISTVPVAVAAGAGSPAWAQSGGADTAATALTAGAGFRMPPAPGDWHLPHDPAGMPSERRRRGVALPAGLGAAVAAIALLIAGTIGVLAMLGGGDDGGARSATFQPGGSDAGVAIVPPTEPTRTPSAEPSPTAPASATPTSAPTATPTTAVTPTPEPTSRPTPNPTPRATARATATPRPTPATGGGGARSPAETIRRFYELVEAHRYDAAARLWSPRMRREYPPDGNIDGRFDATTDIGINRLRTDRADREDGEAVVFMDITESRSSGAARRWVGTWDLVLVDGTWLMDDPHLAGG